MHPALQIALGVASLVVVLSQIVARWGGRAQRQESDGRVLERVEGAAQSQAVTGATLSATLQTLTDTVSKMSATLDGVASKMSVHDVAVAEARVKADADRDRVTRLEAQVTDSAARLVDVDHRQTEARHTLRAEMHTAMAALRAEVTNAPRSARRGQ
jgi:chromosome segregation ATPase